MDVAEVAVARSSRRRSFGSALDDSAGGGRASWPRRPLRVAMLAPPWLSVPPSGYGGVESVVSALTKPWSGEDMR